MAAPWSGGRRLFANAWVSVWKQEQQARLWTEIPRSGLKGGEVPTGKVPTRKLGQTDWQAEELRVLEADLGEDEIRQLKEADVGNILEVWRILGDSTRLKRKHSESGSGEVPEEVAEGREPGKELEELGEEEEEEQQEEEEEGEQ